MCHPVCIIESSARSSCVRIHSHEVVNVDKSHYSEAQRIHFSASLKQTREEDEKGCGGGGTHQTPLESWMSNFLSPMTLTIALLLMLPPLILLCPNGLGCEANALVATS